MAKYVVAPAADVPPGGRKRVELRGRPVVIFNLGGEFFAMLDRCPHQGGNLSEGCLVGLIESTEPGQYVFSRQNEIIRCPWHGWEFDIRTGQARCEPDRFRATQYDVDVAQGAVLGDGVGMAETFDVTVEDSYIVVDV